jgi:predicted peroxiredoxin
MRRLVTLPLVVLLSAGIFAACQRVEAPAPSRVEPAKDGIFVHIKSGPDDAHSVLMGLHLAQRMASDRDVFVYFDVKGINVVLRSSEDLTLEPFGSAREMIADLLSRGVSIQACPGWLKALGHTPEELLEGVQVADKDDFFTFTAGRILTIDY